MMYSEPRFTKDLDLWISVDPENARAVYSDLRAFGALYIKGRSDSDQASVGSSSRPDRRGAVGERI
jgi:hypothetical protein